jgi:hypothetical protein
MANVRKLFFVVDTNVPLVANYESVMSNECVLVCVERLRKLMEYDIIVIDDRFEIINEYKKKLHPSGQPGVGDEFLKWILTNYANPKKCNIVSITPINKKNFKEFPKHSDLANFDKTDRKFVAVANSHDKKPPILQASDSKWLNYEKTLNDCGITVNFLCRDELEEILNR